MKRIWRMQDERFGDPLSYLSGKLGHLSLFLAVSGALQ